MTYYENSLLCDLIRLVFDNQNYCQDRFQKTFEKLKSEDCIKIAECFRERNFSQGKSRDFYNWAHDEIYKDVEAVQSV